MLADHLVARSARLGIAFTLVAVASCSSAPAGSDQANATELGKRASGPGVTQGGYALAGYVYRGDLNPGPSEPPYRCLDFPNLAPAPAAFCSHQAVELVNKSTGETEWITTDQAGYFAFTTLDAGQYALVVQDLDGYGAAISTVIDYDPTKARDPADFIIEVAPNGGSFILQPCASDWSDCEFTNARGTCGDGTRAVWCENGHLLGAACESACVWSPTQGAVCSDG